ncbi:MAG: hypothetical protein R3246_09095 [Acidimicrobiia bacterium]|nr:hypothetical protein [Acidimicrobiia bacterium]
MLTNQIAAAVTAVVLAVSGVALTAGDDTATVEAGTSAEAQGSTSVTVDDSPSTTVEGESSTSVTIEGSTSTTIDDDNETDDDNDDTTSTTVGDDDDDDSETDDDARPAVELGMRSYTVGNAGTVVMDGMVLVGVIANPGWTVEIDEASADRVEIEFVNGEAEAEFELRIDGRVEIKTEG